VDDRFTRGSAEGTIYIVGWANRELSADQPSKVNFISLALQRTCELEVPKFSKLTCQNLCLRQL